MKIFWKLALVFVVFVLAGIFAIDWYYGRIDKCQDNGGCWDYRSEVCRNKNEPEAQRLCDKSQSH